MPSCPDCRAPFDEDLAYCPACGRANDGVWVGARARAAERREPLPPPPPLPRDREAERTRTEAATHPAETTAPASQVAAPPGERSWNNWSILGFVFALFVPSIGLFLSAIAFLSTDNRVQRGRQLALAGLVIALARITT